MVRETIDAFFATLKRNLTIFLTWAYTTDLLTEKGVSAQQLAEALNQIVPEVRLSVSSVTFRFQRVLPETWFKKFAKTIAKEHRKTELLDDQILDRDDPDEKAEEPVVEQEPVAKIITKEDIVAIVPSCLFFFLAIIAYFSD